MRKTFKVWLTSSSFLFLLLIAGGCDSGPDNTKPVYEAYRFDQKVIGKLPLYDSLAVAILQQFNFLRSLNGKDSNQAFRYGPASTESEVFKRLPAEAGPGIDRYFTQLGANFIEGFDVFHDSTIKIYIRTFSPPGSKINVSEHLSYYPAGTKIKQREFPFKDTVLNDKWQYWARVRKRELF